MLRLDDDRIEHSLTKWVLPPLLVFSVVDDVQQLQIPRASKNINWRTTRSMPKFIAIVVTLSLTVVYYQWMPAVIFITYLPLRISCDRFLSRQIKGGALRRKSRDEEEPENP